MASTRHPGALLAVNGLSYKAIKRCMIMQREVDPVIRVDRTRNSYVKTLEKSESLDHTGEAVTYALFYKGKEIILFESGGIVKFQAPKKSEILVKTRLQQIFAIHVHYGNSPSFPCFSAPNTYRWTCSGHVHSWFGFYVDTGRYFIPQPEFYRGPGRTMPEIQSYPKPKSYRNEREKKKAEGFVEQHGLVGRPSGEVWSRGDQKWLIAGYGQRVPYLGNWFTGSSTVEVVKDFSVKPISAEESLVERIVLGHEPWRLVPYTNWLDDNP